MQPRNKWFVGIIGALALFGVLSAANERALEEKKGQTSSAQPYSICERQVFNQSTMPGYYRLRYIITPVERDMAQLTSLELAKTAYAALKHLEGDPKAISTTVLLLEHCKGTVALARAQVGASPGEAARLVKGNRKQPHGPSLEMVRLSEALHEVKGEQERESTDADYASAAKRLGVSPEQARALHVELATHMGLDDVYETVEGILAQGPTIR